MSLAIRRCMINGQVFEFSTKDRESNWLWLSSESTIAPSMTWIFVDCIDDGLGSVMRWDARPEHSILPQLTWAASVFLQGFKMWSCFDITINRVERGFQSAKAYSCSHSAIWSHDWDASSSCCAARVLSWLSAAGELVPKSTTLSNEPVKFRKTIYLEPYLPGYHCRIGLMRLNRRIFIVFP